MNAVGQAEVELSLPIEAIAGFHIVIATRLHFLVSCERFGDPIHRKLLNLNPYSGLPLWNESCTIDGKL
jgi:hypothetical protein